jgi:hypothetical protein
MKDPHVYARDDASIRAGLINLRRNAHTELSEFLFSGTEPNRGDVVRFYCHMYALEAAYQGDQSQFDEEGNLVLGGNEQHYPRYTLYYALYSETLRALINTVLEGEGP